MHFWSGKLRVSVVAGAVSLAAVGCSGSGSPTTLGGSSRSVLVATDAPRLHGAEVVSGTYRLSDAGSQMVTLPLKAALPTGDAAIVVSAVKPGGPWTYVPATVAQSGRAVTFTAAGPARFTVLGLAVAPLERDFKSFFADSLESAATMPINQPSCPGQQAALSGYQVEASQGSAISWCLGIQGGNRILTMVNDRTYPLEIFHQGMPVAESASADSFRLTSLSQALSGSYSILEPGQQIGYGVVTSSGTVNQVSTQFDGLGESLFVLQTAMSTLLEILNELKPTDTGNLGRIMNAATEVSGCAGALTAREPVALMSGCLSPSALVRIFQAAGLGTIGWLLAPVVGADGVAAFFNTKWQHIHNLLTSRDYYTITVGRGACPTAAQLLTAWNTAPASVRQGWAGTEIFAFQDISCWGGWVVAMPVGNGNGTFVFSQQGGLHPEPVSQLPQFEKAVCSTHKSPADWKFGGNEVMADCKP